MSLAVDIIYCRAKFLSGYPYAYICEEISWWESFDCMLWWAAVYQVKVTIRWWRTENKTESWSAQHTYKSRQVSSVSPLRQF